MSKDVSLAIGKPTRDDLVRENERLKTQIDVLQSSRLASNVAAVLKALIRGLTILGIAVCAVYAIHEMAGKVTDFKAIFDANLHQGGGEHGDPIIVSIAKYAVAAAVVAILSSIWIARRALRLKRDATTSLSEYRRRYEELIDPMRTSSGLRLDGTTREGDEL